MGIINAGRVIIGDEELQKAKEAEAEIANQRVVTSTTTPTPIAAPKPAPAVVEEPQKISPPSGDHHILVVDGKVKKVAKRSQYLLDMMTTEE